MNNLTSAIMINMRCVMMLMMEDSDFVEISNRPKEPEPNCNICNKPGPCVSNVLDARSYLILGQHFYFK